MIPYSEANDVPYVEVELNTGEQLNYEAFVCNLVKQMGTQNQNICHMALGITGEAGELADGIKKAWAYEKPLDMQNMIEELGDLEFYMAGLRQMLNITRRQVLNYNVVKLQARYSGGTFTNEAAIARDDKITVLTPSGESPLTPLVTPTPIPTPPMPKLPLGVLVSEDGEVMQASNLQVIDMSLPTLTTLPTQPLDLRTMSADEIAGVPIEPSDPMPQDGDQKMPDWLRTVLVADITLRGETVVAWHIHRGTATVLTEAGATKQYYEPMTEEMQQFQPDAVPVSEFADTLPAAPAPTDLSPPSEMSVESRSADQAAAG